MEKAVALNIDLNMKNNNGMTAFHLACKTYGTEDIVNILMENAEDLNINLNIKTSRAMYYCARADKLSLELESLQNEVEKFVGRRIQIL